VACKRLRCDKFVTCSRTDCTLAHAAQAFGMEDLNGPVLFRPRRHEAAPRFPYA
jgi:hypothetical protein